MALFMNHRNEWELRGKSRNKTEKCEVERVGKRRVFENIENIETYGQFRDSLSYGMVI